MKTKIILCLLALLLIATGCVPPSSSIAKGAPQSIFLVTVDGLAPDSRLFREGTRLSTLAGEGTRWNDGWTTTPMSRPAAASYLTGLATDRHGVVDDLFSSLPAEVRTLAAALAERGYETAAFPDSSLLGAASGLHRDFGIVAAPPAIPISPVRWIPSIEPGRKTVDHVDLWLDGLAENQPHFAWVHFSQPFLAQVGRIYPLTDDVDPATKPDELTTGPEDVENAFDAALGSLMDSLDSRGLKETGLVIVAGTFGDVRGRDGDPVGPGFSITERPLRIPVILRFPAFEGTLRSAEAAVWTPDVPATIAELAGARLSDRAEGLSLTQEPEEGRTLFAGSWAPLDQLGFAPLKAARSGGVKVRTESGAERLDGAELTADDESAGRRLMEALNGREEPVRQRLALDDVREILESVGIEVNPIPEGGRESLGLEVRRGTVDKLWEARVRLRRNQGLKAKRLTRAVLRSDPDAAAGLLDRGQILILSGDRGAEEVLSHGVSLYPQDPEMLHWYVHSIWDRRGLAEQLLEKILPYKGSDWDVLYDIACVRSLNEDIEGSVTYLRSALEAGFDQWDLISTDVDLRNLRASPKFAELMREYQR